jgi:acyl carrier protein
MRTQLRELVSNYAGLAIDVDGIADDYDLYRAGMKSFATVQLMMSIEDEFGIEFPEEMLTRDTFRSIAAMERAVSSLRAGIAA